MPYRIPFLYIADKFARFWKRGIAFFYIFENASRIRATRKIVKKIVDQSIATDEAESIIVGIDDLENIDVSTKPLAIGISTLLAVKRVRFFSISLFSPFL